MTSANEAIDSSRSELAYQIERITSPPCNPISQGALPRSTSLQNGASPTATKPHDFQSSFRTDLIGQIERITSPPCDIKSFNCRDPLPKKPDRENGATQNGAGSSFVEIIALEGPEHREEVHFTEYLDIIESVLLSDAFCDAQEEFFLRNCDKFFVNSDSGEFSHDCIIVFQKYCLWVEKVIESEVHKRNVSLNIGQFISILQGQISQLQGEVFDTLYSMSDFTHFQNTMLQYRRLKRPKSRSTQPQAAPRRSASSSNIPYERLSECLTISSVRPEHEERPCTARTPHGSGTSPGKIIETATNGVASAITGWDRQKATTGYKRFESNPEPCDDMNSTKTEKRISSSKTLDEDLMRLRCDDPQEPDKVANGLDQKTLSELHHIERRIEPGLLRR